MASSGAGALNLRGADHGVSDDSSSQQHHHHQHDDMSDALTTTTMDDDKAQFEDWDEGCDTMFVCLFCPESFHTRNETLTHCLSHGFDLNKIKREWDLDMFGVVKLINYIRHKVKDDETSDSWDSPSFSDLKSNHKLMDAERYLQPVLEDDPLLYEMDGDDSDFDDDDDQVDEPKPTNVDDLLRKLDAAERRAQAAEHKAAQLEGVVGEYKALIERLVAEKENADQNPSTTNTTTVATTTTKETVPTPNTDKTVATTTTDISKEEFEDAGVSHGYFSSYAHFGIHMSMLKDAVRTDSYRDAIYLNKHIFKDKVVLDIGCGTGILSMFAARSGAKKVIGIDRSDIVIKAQQIVKKNQLDDVVTIIRGEVEKVTLPVDKVDIIISEWMGYFLIYESMLDTVLFARDKWLQPGGLVQPSKVEMLMYAASMEDYFNDNISWWSDVYGFDMECMRDSVLKEAQVDVIPNEEIISPPALMKTFDILQTKKEDQEFYSTFELQINQARDCHAFVGYFDTEFAWGNHANGQRVFFSTGSHATPTHWRQTVFLLEEPITELAVGDSIKVSLTCRRNTEYFRALHLWLEWTVVRGGVESAKKSQSFHLS